MVCNVCNCREFKESKHLEDDGKMHEDSEQSGVVICECGHLLENHIGD